jgi:ubiquinone/menaquinone biosynthesis C-methylase UbiE
MRNTILASSAKTWEKWAKKDPLWAILSSGRRWETEAFFETGRIEVQGILDHCRDLDIALQYDGTALDFGCGVGRLSRALAGYFGEVIGVDIAPSMIALAKQYNDGPQFRFFANQEPDLALLPDASVDFIYTSIVLQHIPPLAVKQYVAEFFRILRPGGAMSIHMPSTDATWGSGRKALIRKIIGRRNYELAWAILRGTGTDIIEMNYIPEPEMTSQLKRLGFRIIEIASILPNPIRQHRRYILPKVSANAEMTVAALWLLARLIHCCSNIKASAGSLPMLGGLRTREEERPCASG